MEQKPLASFRVLAPDGAAVQSAALSSEERWLLIYAAPECHPSDQLLRKLRRWQSPHLTRRVVLVVGAQIAEAQAFVQDKLPGEVNGISWYADAEQEAWHALGLKATPALIGIRNGRMEWAISGLLQDAATMTSVVRTWVEY
jgi:hypothetical protein